MSINEKLFKKTKQSFQSQKVLTIDQLSNLLQCATITARRFLKSSRAFTSYNQKGRYYTLPSIPKFDKYGIWHFNDAFFSTHGNLKNAVVHLVAHSSIGLSAMEIGKIVSLEPTSFMHYFRDINGIQREKHNGRFIYFSDNSKVYSTQILKRISVREQIKSLPSDTDAVLILVQYIKHPNITIEKFFPKIAKTVKNLDLDSLKYFLEYHGLQKKIVDMQP